MAGDALIDRARSQEASYFLKQRDDDILLFVDDDVQYEPEDAIKICTEAKERQTIVGGTYVNKKEDYTWITAKLNEGQEVIFSKNSPLTEVRWLATGFMAIPRNVLTDMVYELKLPLCHPTDLKFYPFFQPFPWKHSNGDYIYLSEDWAFCERARSLGYKILLDPSIRLGHAGRYVYSLDDLHRAPRTDNVSIRYRDREEDTSKDVGEKILGEVTLVK